MIPVGILGATGMVGRRYAALLADHPWFKLTFVAASPKSVGQPYGNNLTIEPIDSAVGKCKLLFCCVGERQAALHWEKQYAEAGLTLISNTAAHRSDPLVPVIIPEINAHHLDVLDRQPWRGNLIAKPNCSLQSYLLPLYPLHRTHRIQRLIVTTLQALSGAGDLGADMSDNIIPYIAGEEEKSETEPLKILGEVGAEGIVPHRNLTIAAHCNRVPVTDGHTACVSVGFARKPTRAEIITAWDEFEGLDLPSAPKRPIHYRPETDRPQPICDRDTENGMAVTVGRLRPCPVLDWRFVALSHNTLRGAAGGGILNAELFMARHRGQIADHLGNRIEGHGTGAHAMPLGTGGE